MELELTTDRDAEKKPKPLDWTVSNLITAKNEAYEQLTGKPDSDKLEASEAFVKAAKAILDTTYSNTHAYMANTGSIQSQIAGILNTNSQNNVVRDTIAPLAHEVRIPGF